MGSHQAAIGDDFESEEFYSDVSKLFSQEGLRSGISLPLLGKDGPIATMTLASRSDNAFTGSDMELMIQIAVQIPSLPGFSRR